MDDKIKILKTLNDFGKLPSNKVSAIAGINYNYLKPLLEELKKAVELDRARTGINGFTALGLVEMTRKRTRESLAHLLCEPCEVCNGRGEYKTAQTICYEVMRELLRESKQFNAKEFKVIASTDVINMLLDEESQSLANLSDFMNKRLTLQAESQYAREVFDIVLI